MSQQIVPCLWFNTQAEEAIHHYLSLFPNSKIHSILRYPDPAPSEHMRGMEGKILTAVFELAGQTFQALDGGPQFKLTPAISFFVNCADVAEVDRLWAALSDGGEVLMPLGSYPWNARYGWCQDRYGVSWQVLVGQQAQKIQLSFLFTQAQHGKAEEALKFYASLFKDGRALQTSYYTDGAAAGLLQYGEYSLNGQTVSAMDSGIPHEFTFTEALSLVVECSTQAEIDRLWDALSAVPEAEACGWLKDRYGVSWQIVPTGIEKVMNDPEKAERVLPVLLQMKKLDLAALEAAARGE